MLRNGNMLKKTLMGVVVSLGLVSSVSASDLKSSMNMMASSLSTTQYAYLTNNPKMAMESLTTLKKQVDDALKDENNIVEMLPKKLQHKSSIAINSAKMISKYIADIQAVAADKNMTPIKREMEAQKSFANIEGQCFRCHNLVRDWQ
jgi:hypothetical protein